MCVYLQCVVDLLLLFLQVSTLVLQLVVSSQQPSLLLLPHCSHTHTHTHTHTVSTCMDVMITHTHTHEDIGWFSPVLCVT